MLRTPSETKVEVAMVCEDAIRYISLVDSLDSLRSKPVVVSWPLSRRRCENKRTRRIPAQWAWPQTSRAEYPA